MGLTRDEFRDLFERQRDPLYRFLYRLTGNRADAEDLLRFRHHDELITLKPVDPVQNARTPRLRKSTTRPAKNDSPAPNRPKTAAHLLFDRDFKPVVTPDGDCLPTTPYNKEDS